MFFEFMTVLSAAEIEEFLISIYTTLMQVPFVAFIIEFIKNFLYNPVYDFLQRRVPFFRITWMNLLIIILTYQIILKSLDLIFYLIQTIISNIFGFVRDIFNTLFSNVVDLIKDLIRAFVIFLGTRLWELTCWIFKKLANSGMVKDGIPNLYYYMKDTMITGRYYLQDWIDKIRYS